MKELGGETCIFVRFFVHFKSYPLQRLKSTRHSPKLGSAFSVLDMLHLGSSLALRQFAQIGSSPPTTFSLDDNADKPGIVVRVPTVVA